MRSNTDSDNQTGTGATPAVSPAQARWADDARTLELSGDWTVHGMHRVPEPSVPEGARSVCLRGFDWRLDSAGALVLAHWAAHWRASGTEVDLSGLEPAAQRLVALVAERQVTEKPARQPRLNALAVLGRFVIEQLDEARHLLAFVGELAWRGLPQLLTFWRIRWREVTAEIDAAGVRALGIVGLLSFLIGMVMAYQGGATLSNYGANILIVNLVSIITLREMGPLLAAILVAGRTGSSYTAQLGTMRITEEIDALRALGLSPFSMLVLPKVIALVIVLPLLSLFADAMGLVGGGVVASFGYGVSWSVYLDRIPQVASVTTLVLGLVKAPVFAVVIALIGCMQGMRVRGSAADVGRATTVSVVQSIFMVIVLDAAFSVLYNLMEL